MLVRNLLLKKSFFKKINSQARSIITTNIANITPQNLPTTRLTAFLPPVVAKPDQLNLEESTSVIYRLMSIPELQHILDMFGHA